MCTGSRPGCSISLSNSLLVVWENNRWWPKDPVPAWETRRKFLAPRLQIGLSAATVVPWGVNQWAEDHCLCLFFSLSICLSNKQIHKSFLIVWNNFIYILFTFYFQFLLIFRKCGYSIGSVIYILTYFFLWPAWYSAQKCAHNIQCPILNIRGHSEKLWDMWDFRS